MVSFLRQQKPGSVIIAIIVVILALLILLIMIGAMAFVGTLTGEKSPFAGGGGGLCNEVPSKYQEIFQDYDNDKIPAALLAAVFRVEHGRVEEYRSGYTPTNSKNDPWPEKDGDPTAIIRWQTSSAGALGPMQFMPDTWSDYGSGNPQNINDAVKATGNMLTKNYDSNSGTPEEKMKKAISRYNPGAGPWNNSWYVDRVWKYYEEFRCETGGMLAGRMNVPYIEQGQTGWCGRASQAMVAAYFNPSNYNLYANFNFQASNPLSASTLAKLTGKSYQYGNPSINQVIASLSKGYPALVYTDFYSLGQHIFVLTGFDGERFWANDTFGGAARSKDMQIMAGVPLTKENLQNHLKAQGGHTFLYVP